MAQFESKPHYLLLDGLRGVAALIVIAYHVCEGFATSALDQGVNHGHLAVDFFFILSGFVMGFAYDGRWKQGLTKGNFFKRRFIRLHPMVVLGAVVGTVTFFIQGAQQWDHTRVGTGAVMLAMLLTMCMIPSAPGTVTEVRGNGELFPLNGPTWSLFFEYIGNILYALFLHKLSTKALRWVVVGTGILLAVFAIGNGSGGGHLGVGWSMAGRNMYGGFLRMGFSYSLGLLLVRTFQPRPVRGAFWKCSLILVVLLSVPHLATFTPNGSALWLNGLYEVLCVMVVFPLLVRMAASGTPRHAGFCKLLGDLSYPLYIIHYPFMYLFYYWLWNTEGLTRAQIMPVAALLVVGCLALAYAALKLYDEPLRGYLQRKW